MFSSCPFCFLSWAPNLCLVHVPVFSIFFGGGAPSLRVVHVPSFFSSFFWGGGGEPNLRLVHVPGGFDFLGSCAFLFPFLGAPTLCFAHVPVYKNLGHLTCIELMYLFIFFLFWGA